MGVEPLRLAQLAGIRAISVEAISCHALGNSRDSEGSMSRLTRVALIMAIAGLSSQALGCVYTAKGRVYANGRAYRFRVQNAPCPDTTEALVVAPPAYAAPPPVYVQPMYEPLPPPPIVFAAPQPVYASPPVVVAPAPPRPPKDDRPALIALKYAPGASAAVDWGSGAGSFGITHSVGLEVRLSRWFALRSDFEMRPEGRSWDMIGLKVWLFPPWALRPYGSVSLAGSEAYAAPGKYQLGVSAAAGADLFFGKHFFLEAEARYRVSPGAGECCREVPHLSVLIGGGVAFF